MSCKYRRIGHIGKVKLILHVKYNGGFCFIGFILIGYQLILFLKNPKNPNFAHHAVPGKNFTGTI